MKPNIDKYKIQQTTLFYVDIYTIYYPTINHYQIRLNYILLTISLNNYTCPSEFLRLLTNMRIEGTVQFNYLL